MTLPDPVTLAVLAFVVLVLLEIIASETIRAAWAARDTGGERQWKKPTSSSSEADRAGPRSLVG